MTSDAHRMPSTGALTLADFTAPGLIIPHLRGRDATSVIQELSQVLQHEKRIPDLLPFYQGALNAEFMVSSDLQPGMAFPQARLSALREVSYAFGRLDRPIVWGAKSNGSVRLVFLLALPATDSTQYLLLHAGLARLGRDPGLIERLLGAEGIPEILQTLKQVELPQNLRVDPIRKGSF